MEGAPGRSDNCQWYDRDCVRRHSDTHRARYRVASCRDGSISASTIDSRLTSSTGKPPLLALPAGALLQRLLDGTQGYVLRGQGDGRVFDAVAEGLRLP